MTLPDGFVFSQSSLQDYVDCARRFQLRYLEHCRWPAPETEDALEFERRMRQGHAFHHLMHQLHAGIPAKVLEAAMADEPELAHWWANYRDTPPQDLPTKVREAEVTLSVAWGNYRLEAKYDLLAGQPGGRWVIVDWKTGQRRSSRDWLRRRLQTRIYPFVLVKAGATLNDGMPISAQQVEMLYWFAEFPQQPERFVYSEEQFADDAVFLEALLREIEARREEVFPLTENKRLCRYCVYRSLCHENVQAGPLAELGEVEGIEASLEDIDLESIVPIPF